MSKYHNAFQGFVKVFTAAAKPGVKGNPTTIIGVSPSKNIKKFTEQKEKIIKMTDKYKSKVNDPEVKKSMNKTTSKTLGDISKILKGEKVKKADGGRSNKPFGTYHPPSPTGFNITIPNSEPAPNNSLTTPTHINNKPYPKPFPIPSTKESMGLFCIAKASALPITIQFVIIRPTKTDRVLDIS